MSTNEFISCSMLNMYFIINFFNRIKFSPCKQPNISLISEILGLIASSFLINITLSCGITILIWLFINSILSVIGIYVKMNLYNNDSFNHNSKIYPSIYFDNESTYIKKYKRLKI